MIVAGTYLQTESIKKRTGGQVLVICLESAQRRSLVLEVTFQADRRLENLGEPQRGEADAAEQAGGGTVERLRLF